MNKRNRNSRKYSRKALDIVEVIQEKYPEGISDGFSISEEARAWIEKKVQQTRECLKNVKFPSKPSWFETLRVSRNKTAHQTEDFTNEEFSELCSNLFTNIGKIKKDLDENIKRYKQSSRQKRTFENFAPSALGSESERKQLVDAMEDAIQPVEPQDEHINFPDNKPAQIAQNMLSEILEFENVKDHALTHTGFSENIQTDILACLQNMQTILEKENPFFEEEIFIHQQEKLSAFEIAADISDKNSKIQYHYKRLPSVSSSKRENIAESTLDFSFYSKEFSAQKKIAAEEQKISENEIDHSIQWISAENLEALRRNFIADMERNFIERKNQWEQQRIDELRKQFLDELYKKIQHFMHLEKLLSPFIRNWGRLWDLSDHLFETSGFEIIDTFARLLEQDESLQELAEILGKHCRTQEIFEKETREEAVITTEWHSKPAYRGELNGLRYSNDISSLLPTELSMLRNSSANKLFQLKFAQKQLLSFDYLNDELEEQKTKKQKEVSVEKKDPKGPIIICVDTSGSMHGTPENIAKTVTFALAKIAVEQDRKCYVISFSQNIQTHEITPNKDMEMTGTDSANYIQKLVAFLQMSFNGGTDAEPALNNALNMLSGSDKAAGYTNADVLMISDFVMGNLSDDLVNDIEAEKEKNTDFYSLVIGSGSNKNATGCFNHNWLYDTTDIHASRHLVEQLQELKLRK